MVSDPRPMTPVEGETKMGARPEGMDVYMALLAKEIETQRRNAAAMPISSSHWAAQADWLERIYDYLRAAPDQSQRIAELEEALRAKAEEVDRLRAYLADEGATNAKLRDSLAYVGPSPAEDPKP